MSRVDDDREAARAAEKLMLQKQQAEAKAKDKAGAESAFSKLVKESQQQKGQTAQRKDADAQQSSKRLSSSILEEAMAEMMGASQEQAKDAEKGGTARHLGKAFNEKLRQSSAGEGERMGQSFAAEQEHEGAAASGRSQDSRAGESRAESRRADAKLQREQDDKDNAATARSGALGKASRDKGELSSDADGGGQSGQGGDKKEGGGELAAGFRFNPALMAPVPVAKPKDSGASERLRKLANEIAQKIVERVRVGTNATGQAEFQIDLRSNVLAGLSIKVSGGNGKIKAVFSGNDREVMKLLREQSEGLKSALAGRGLALEELKIEEKA